MQKGDGTFKLLFSKEESDYCTDSKIQKIIIVKKRTGKDTNSSFLISENRNRNTYYSSLLFFGLSVATGNCSGLSRGNDSFKRRGRPEEL